jgi:uncharacterized membrane protein YjfL (UPF0719 family)
MVQELLLEFILSGIQILGAIVLSAGALYSGISLLDRLSPGIDEWKLIKKGNLAVGIFYATVMLSIMYLVVPLIEDLIYYIQTDFSLGFVVVALILSFINYLLGLLFSVILIFLTIHVIDRLTHDLDEMEQLEKGNVAVALIMSAVLFAVVFASSEPFNYLFSLIRGLEASIL